MSLCLRVHSECGTAGRRQRRKEADFKPLPPPQNIQNEEGHNITNNVVHKEGKNSSIWKNSYPRKVKVGFFLPVDLVSEFRELVARKYGTLQRGLLSLEAELALRRWISQHTKAQTPLQALPAAHSRVDVVFMQVINYISTHYMEDIRLNCYIPVKFIREAISQIRGSDRRTLKKWLEVFVRHGYLKAANPVASAFTLIKLPHVSLNQ